MWEKLVANRSLPLKRVCVVVVVVVVVNVAVLLFSTFPNKTSSGDSSLTTTPLSNSPLVCC